MFGLTGLRRASRIIFAENYCAVALHAGHAADLLVLAPPLEGQFGGHVARDRQSVVLDGGHIL